MPDRRGETVRPTLAWIVLTRGDRPVELERALTSLRRQDPPAPVVVIANGVPPGQTIPGDSCSDVVVLPSNVGIPAGRHHGVGTTNADVVAFLDDDAELLGADANRRILEAFGDPTVVAVSFRLENERGAVQPRHVPRVGGRDADRSGPVVNFLGGACAIRRDAYERAGGYWGDLFYAHEELDLAWRLHDGGGTVLYRPDVIVRHPHMPIGRHTHGWNLTGRNRVMIARRDLPWPVAAVHVVTWLIVGTVRAPDRRCRSAYLDGWWSGWRTAVDRRPVAWRTVVRLARLGRPPVI